jgi:hypothetical protein
MPRFVGLNMVDKRTGKCVGITEGEIQGSRLQTVGSSTDYPPRNEVSAGLAIHMSYRDALAVTSQYTALCPSPPYHLCGNVSSLDLILV